MCTKDLDRVNKICKSLIQEKQLTILTRCCYANPTAIDHLYPYHSMSKKLSDSRGYTLFTEKTAQISPRIANEIIPNNLLNFDDLACLLYKSLIISIPKKSL
jgi:hypothetical protein